MTVPAYLPKKVNTRELFGWMIINPGNMTTTHIPQMTPAMILGVCGSDSRYMAVPVKASMINIAVKPDNLMPSKFFSCVFIMIVI